MTARKPLVQIAGTIQELPTSDTIPDTSVGGTTAGAIPFVSAAGGPLAESANLTWDNTNKRLGVGATAPDTFLTVNANTGAVPIAVSSGTLFHLVGADGGSVRFFADVFGTGAFLFNPRKFAGTRASPTPTAAGTILTFNAAGYDGSTAAICATFALAATETFSTSAHGAKIVFNTIATGTTTLVETVSFQADTGLSMYGANPVIDANRLHVFRAYTVATLPTGVGAYSKAFVTDATSTHAAGIGATPTGGGSNKVPVYTVDGTHWLIG